MDILIAGDLVPTKQNMDLFNESNVQALLGKDIFALWDNSDIKILNLETPITDIETPIDKSGPNLITPTKSFSGIKALKPSLVNLANNHILDQGIQGLKSTVDLLNENKIPYLGVGENLSEAYKPYIINKDGKKVGVYSCAEQEFSIATKTTAGANPFDPLESLDHIQKLKEECDYVIVLYHGGKEHYRYPSPYLQKICRKIVEKGADIVICQHSHCVGCFEEYNNSTIVYGQGNFIFNKHDNEFWNNSLLINITLENEIGIRYIPIIKKGKGISLAKEDIGNKIIFSFYDRSNEILKEDFVESQYKNYAKENLDSYLRRFSGFGKWTSRIDRYLLKGNLLQRKYRKNELLAIKNIIRCEAHRELLLTGLNNKGN